MGLPALSISKQLLDELPTILSNIGITVSELPISKEDARSGFIMVLACSSDPEAVVQIHVQRVERIAPDGIVAVLHPAPASWTKAIAQDRIMKRIEATLRKGGASDPTRKR